MNFINPHFFAAVLENVPHRFILIQECEFLGGYEGFQPPRFSVGAMNATRDPRYAQFRQLMPIGVANSSLQIPPSWLMAHQYIYIVHDRTDKCGWQYRSTWPSTAIPSAKEEQWVKDYISQFHYVRRRIWMTTIVQRIDLVRTKRLLSDNVHIDHGTIKLQGELFRYEKGTLTKAWNKRRVILHQNRIEFYSGNNKKGEVPLNECEIKMLTPEQCQGRQYAFSIRNPTGSVGILLDADDRDTRRDWVLAIQYQLALNSDNMNFNPLEYAPPTGTYPDNRVMLSSDLKILGKDGKVWLPRHFQLLPREIICFNEGDELKGRIFVEQATITPDDKDQRRFNITSATGISLNLSSDSNDSQTIRRDWIEGVKKQVDMIENQKLKQKTVPKEELNDDHLTPIQRIGMFYEDNWMAPAVEGEDEEYLSSIFTAPYRNHPDHYEFNEDLGINLDPRLTNHRTMSRDRSNTMGDQQSSSPNPSTPTGSTHTLQYQQSVKTISATSTKTISNVFVSNVTNNVTNTNTTTTTTTMMTNNGTPGSSTTTTMTSIFDGLNNANTTNNSEKTNSFNEDSKLVINNAQSYSPSTPSPIVGSKQLPPLEPANFITKYLDPKRVLINPRFMLSCLKTINHRFVLVLECEFFHNAPRDVQARAPPRFSVGGPRASKDPRIVSLNQLLEISNRNPEIQFPPGWFTLHPYVYIVQQNTDDDGWQYRSTWSEGNVGPNEEPWSDSYDSTKFVRRRMWMTTVVRKDDMMKAKKLAADAINKPRDDAIFQEYLQVYQPLDTTNSAGISNNSSNSSAAITISPSAGGASSINSSGATTIVGTTTLTKGSWERCKVLLYHKKLEFYNGHDKVGDVSIVDCEVRALEPSMDPIVEGRENVFCIQHPLGHIYVLFQCDSAESRLRWMRSLTYQILVVTQDMNFDPLVFSPPTGELPEQRVLYCGDLQLLDSTNGNNRWETFQILLQEQALLCLFRSSSTSAAATSGSTTTASDNNASYGKLLLDGATVRSREEDNEFTLKVNTGFQIHFRAENTESRLNWTMAIRRCVENIKLKKRSFVRDIPIRERVKQFHDGYWTAVETGEVMAEEDYLRNLRDKYLNELGHFWPSMPVGGISTPIPMVSRQNSQNNSNSQPSLSGFTNIEASSTSSAGSKRSSRDLSSLSNPTSDLPPTIPTMPTHLPPSRTNSSNINALRSALMAADLGGNEGISTMTSTSSIASLPVSNYNLNKSSVSTPTSRIRSESKIVVQSFVEDDEISDADFEVPSNTSPTRKFSLGGTTAAVVAANKLLSAANASSNNTSPSPSAGSNTKPSLLQQNFASMVDAITELQLPSDSSSSATSTPTHSMKVSHQPQQQITISQSSKISNGQSIKITSMKASMSSLSPLAMGQDHDLLLPPMPTMKSPMHSSTSNPSPIGAHLNEDSLMSSSGELNQQKLVSAMNKPFATGRISSTSGSTDENELGGSSRRKLKPSDVELRPAPLALTPPAKLTSSNSLSNVELRHIESSTTDDEEKKIKRFTLPSVNLRPVTTKKGNSEDDDWDKDFPASSSSGKLSIPIQLRPVVSPTNAQDSSRVKSPELGSRSSEDGSAEAAAQRALSVREKIMMFGGKKK